MAQQGNPAVPVVPPAAAAAVPVVPQAKVDFTACLTVCGLNQLQRDAVVTEGYWTLARFGRNNAEDIDKFAKRVTLLTVNRGGVHFGQVQIQNLKGLLGWIRSHTRRGLVPDPAKFDEATMDRATDEYLNKDKKKVAPILAKVPEKFKPHSLRGWATFFREIENYLASIRGETNVPLSYIIKKDRNPRDLPPTNPTEQLIWNAPLTGSSFKEDNHAVYQIICDGVSDTDGWTWIKEVQNENGRLA